MKQDQQPLPGMEVEPREGWDPGNTAERYVWEQALEGLPFGEAYFALLDEGWYWRDAAYIAWMATPAQQRMPRTQQDLANLLGCGRRTLYRRVKDNPTIKARAAMLASAQLFEHVGDVMQALVESASDPNYKNHPDRKLFLEMADVYRPKQGLVLDNGWDGGADLDGMSEEELRRMAALGAGEDEDE